MGKDNKEIILNLAQKWRSILIEEAEILSSGDLKNLDQLTEEAVKIQARLHDMLRKIDTASLSKDMLNLMRELHERNEHLVAELAHRRNELSVKIGTLRKNKTSIKGYKQNTKAAPRFMSGRT